MNTTAPLRVFLAVLLSLCTLTCVHAAQPRTGGGYVELLTPDNSLLLLIDLQPQFALATHSIDTHTLTVNATGITKAAKVFGVPTILSTNRASTYGGPFFPEVTAVRPDLTVYDRTLISAFDDQRIVEEIRKSGRRKIIIGGLWTDNCVMLPALTALRDGYEVYVLTDVSGDINQSSHDMAILRLVQAGATPVTWLAVMLEWQRDWANARTAGAVGSIFSESMANSPAQ
jgi:nicotinamidase-related amidase